MQAAEDLDAHALGEVVHEASREQRLCEVSGVSERGEKKGVSEIKNSEEKSSEQRQEKQKGGVN